MLTIQEHADGNYTIRLVSDTDGREWAKTDATIIDEVHNAVRHFFGEDEHQDCTPDNCPLCRWEEAKP